MRRKFEFDNINTLRLFDDIISEVVVKCPNIKIELNKEKFYFILEANEEVFEEEKNRAIEIVKSYYPNIELNETEAFDVYRKIVYLENLDCANCAAKVERISKRTLDHESIIVDFATTRMIIETTSKELIDNLVEEVTKITKQVDINIQPKLQMSNNAENINQKESTEKKVNKIMIIIGSIIFAISLILHYFVFRHTCDEGGFNPNNLSNFKIREHLVLVIMYGVTYLCLGYDVILGAFNNIRSGRFFDEKFLMTLATIMAFIIGSYTEAVSVMIFYKIGEILQEHAVNKSRKSINGLIDIRPDTATVVVNDKEIVVDPSEIMINDVIVVKPGERIPLDGVVISGEASLDASALTGESKYIDVKVSSKVLSGAINVNGYLKIKVIKPYGESMVSKIVDMVSNASLKKAKTENFVSKFARYYTPIVCLLAIIIIILNLSIFEVSHISNFQEYIHDSIYPAMIFLVVSCPCALIISVPLGFFGGIGAASKKGILIKGSNYLENLGDVGMIVFDKTGTLTKGQFIVKEIKTDSVDESTVLRLAAHGEAGSIHPIAKSIIEKYGRDNIEFDKIEYLHSPSKKGNKIRFEDEEIAVGNMEYMKELKVKVPNIKSTGLVVYVVVNNQYVGHIILEDEIREESKKTIEDLQRAGIEVAMVSGDNETIAWEVANKLGIKKVYANMSPIDKVKRVRKLKKHITKKIAFVGDGMNDAPVLSCADIGIAMGGLGSDAAIGVADIVLMTDDLSKLVESIGIAKKTKKIVVQNIVFSLVIKLFVLASAAFFPSFTMMWEGVFADVGVSLIAVINSMRASNITNKNVIKLLFKENDK